MKKKLITLKPSKGKSRKQLVGEIMDVAEKKMEKKYHCPDCGQKLLNATDKSYVLFFETCWQCDKLRCEKRGISVDEFNRREANAVSYASLTPEKTINVELANANRKQSDSQKSL